MKMKLTKLPLIGSAVISLFGSARAQVQLGDVLKIDFGNTAPAIANWNQYTSSSGTLALNRFSDGTATGVSITVDGADGNFGAHIDGSAFGGSSDSTIFADHIAGNNAPDDTFTITISGLDDTLSYDIFGGFLRSTANNAWDHTWDVAGDIRINEFSGGQINGFETFTDVVTTSPGEIVFTISDNVNVVSIAELTITASVELDSDADGLNDLWEDEHFGDNSGTVEPSDLTPQDGSGDGYPVADGDGLNNEAEEAAGTDPNVADTDGDSLSDGDEVNTHLTNPTLADTDGDEIDDDKELAGQGQSGASTGFGATDPLLADSDADGVCDGDELDFTPPSDPNTPDDTDGDLIPNATEDANVNCVVDAGETDPLNPDSDGDNLSDGAEDANQNGVVDTGETDPLLADSDGDNIDDDKELVGQDQSGASTGFGPTDPTLVDSDLDGYNDDVELNAGTDPNDINNTPAVPLAAGTTIAIDFGADAGSPTNWNTLATPLGSPDLAPGSVVDLNGTFVTGVGFTTTVPSANAGENAGSDTSASFLPHIPDEAQSDWWFENNAGQYEFTFSGLDPSLSYDLTIGAYQDDSGNVANASTGWEVNGIQMATTSDDLDNSYVIFRGISADTSGDLTITAFNLSLGEPPVENIVSAVSSLVLTAVNFDLQLRIANAANGTDLDFSWENNAGKLYDILRSTDLSSSPSTWPVWAADIPSDASGTNVETYARPGDPKSFFVLVEKDAPPLFAEDFDGVTAPTLPDGWVVGGSSDTPATAWELGTPDNSGFAEPGPSAAYSGDNCVGTNLTALYGPNAAITLTSPALAVPASTASMLRFRQVVEIDGPNLPVGGGADFGTLRLLDANDGDSELAVLEAQVEGSTNGGWTLYSVAIPAQPVPVSVKLEFGLSTDSLVGFELAGWYIDDVEVLEQ